MLCNLHFQIMNKKHNQSCPFINKSWVHMFWQFYLITFLFKYWLKCLRLKTLLQFYTPSLCNAATGSASSRMHTHHLPWQSWGAVRTLQGIDKYNGMRKHNIMHTHNIFIEWENMKAVFSLKRSWDLQEHLLQLLEDLLVPAGLCSLEPQEAPAERNNKLTHWKSVAQGSLTIWFLV